MVVVLVGVDATVVDACVFFRRDCLALRPTCGSYANMYSRQTGAALLMSDL